VVQFLLLATHLEWCGKHIGALSRNCASGPNQFGAAIRLSATTPAIRRAGTVSLCSASVCVFVAVGFWNHSAQVRYAKRNRELAARIAEGRRVACGSYLYGGLPEHETGHPWNQVLLMDRVVSGRPIYLER